MLLVCRHQAGWFPFNLENELRLPGDPANPEDLEEEPQNQDLQEMVAAPHLCSFADFWSLIQHVPR